MPAMARIAAGLQNEAHMVHVCPVHKLQWCKWLTCIGYSPAASMPCQANTTRQQPDDKCHSLEFHAIAVCVMAELSKAKIQLLAGCQLHKIGMQPLCQALRRDWQMRLHISRCRHTSASMQL